ETLEIRPGNRAVVHHAGVFVVDIPEGSRIVDGRLITADGKSSTDRGAGAGGRADEAALPGANKLLSWVPGRGVDSHRAARRGRPPQKRACGGPRAAATTATPPTSPSPSPPASTSTGRFTTTRPASRKKIGRSSASGSTKCR